MINLSFKSVYHLLDRFYTRRSLNGFIYNDIPDNVFEASKLFAIQQEDYKYLDVMVFKNLSLLEMLSILSISSSVKNTLSTFTNLTAILFS